MKKLFVLLIVVMLASLLVACGGGETASAPEPVSLEFSGYDEFRYDPESASVPTGAEVNVTFNNEGMLEHNWLLVSSRVEPTEAVETDAIAGATSGVIAGGETSTFSFTAPPPGDYQIVCTVPGHAAGGMVADFTVTAE